MSRISILHVVNLVASRCGGAPIASQLIAHYQALEGHDVSVCTTNVDFPRGVLPVPTETNLLQGGVSKRYFPVQFRPLLISIPFWIWLKDSIKYFDIVHIHGLYRFPVTYAAYRARKAGVPYVISPHGSLNPFLYQQSHYSLRLKRIYERLFDIPNLDHAFAIHYTAKEEADRAAFLKLRAEPMIVPIGIDWANYKELPKKGNFRMRLGISQQTPLVLFLGRINFTKGLDLLVPAFRLVLEIFSDARLAIVGPDNEGYVAKVRQWCNEQGIVNNVIFVDYLEPEAVKQTYADADVFVLPSYTENFGMTVVEAMACGCPVVISNQVSIWREIQEEKAGLVVNLDSREIAQAICQVLANKYAASVMGKQGRMAAEKRYAWPLIVDKLTQIYQKLILENEKRKERPGV